MAGIHIATSEVESIAFDSFFVIGPYHTIPVTVLAGQVLPKRSVVSFDAAGKVVAWDPAGAGGLGVPVGITAETIDATGADIVQPIYVSGTYNTTAIAWPAATTDAQKSAAFAGAGTAINHRVVLES